MKNKEINDTNLFKLVTGLFKKLSTTWHTVIMGSFTIITRAIWTDTQSNNNATHIKISKNEFLNNPHMMVILTLSEKKNKTKMWW